MAISPEVGIISAILRSGDHDAWYAEGIAPRMFHEYTDEGRWMHDYIVRHQQAPEVAEFKHAFPSFRIAKTSNVQHWAEAMKESHARVSLLTIMDETTEQIEKGDAIAATESMSNSLSTLLHSVKGASASSLTDWSDTFEEVKRRNEKVALGEQVAFPFGFPTLDNVTGGQHPGRLNIIGARLGHGKTWMMLRMATEVIMFGGTALFVSLEMSQFEVSVRLHSLLSPLLGDKRPLSSFDIANGAVDLSAYERLLQAIDDDLEGELIITTGGPKGLDIHGLDALLDTHDPDCTYVDYLTLMNMDGKADDHRAIGKLTSGIKRICSYRNTSVTVAAQLNRQVPMKRDPGPENLARSDSIGQDADLVVNATKITNSIRRGYVGKNRHGPEDVSFLISLRSQLGEVEEVTRTKAEAIMDEDDEEED